MTRVAFACVPREIRRTINTLYRRMSLSPACCINITLAAFAPYTNRIYGRRCTGSRVAYRTACMHAILIPACNDGFSVSSDYTALTHTCSLSLSPPSLFVSLLRCLSRCRAAESTVGVSYSNDEIQFFFCFEFHAGAD